MSYLKKTLFNGNFWIGRKVWGKVPDLSVTVVIPAWNEEDFIASTITSVQNQTYPCDIIVVNDCSTDSTGRIVQSFSNVRYVETQENQGSKSQALNYAVPLVNTDIFICVDADTILKPDSVEKLMRAFNDPEVMSACGFVMSKNDDTFWSSARYAEYALGQSIQKSALSNLNVTMIASGCFFGIRTPFLKKHRFNDRTMAEDMDLTWTAIEEGYDVAFVEDAYCYVSDPRDYKTYKKQVERWFRGYFQCIKARGFSGLFGKNPKLGIAVMSLLLINAFMFPVIMSGTVWFLWNHPDYIRVVVGTTAAVYSFLILFSVWKTGSGLFKTTIGTVNMFGASFISYYLFLKSGIQELVLGQKLSIWHKGH